MNNTTLGVKQRFGIIGMSKALDHAIETAMRVASTDLSVLINGESGVGKEVFSRIIHALSPRKHNQFIAINCGAIPEGTINSELFGHEKGSFTGAMGERKGYFETVDGGTIFLDEIGEMPLDTQAFLLRVLESGEFIRVGSSKTLKTNVRVIAATNVNLLENVQRGRFREDLYYRLSTVPIRVPALKDRREDIHLLFRKFAYDFSERYHSAPIQLEAEAIKILENYSWPGNIRELKNLSEQISVLAKDRLVSTQELLTFMPQLNNRNLPMPNGREQATTFEEREILYKLLFDMKNDLNDLKALVFELIKSNDLQMPTTISATSINMPRLAQNTYTSPSQSELYIPNSVPSSANDTIIFTNNNEHSDFQDTEEVEEESLNKKVTEKRNIIKALQRHNGRRKEAAIDVGMSERTLYRKIIEYGLENMGNKK